MKHFNRTRRIAIMAIAFVAGMGMQLSSAAQNYPDKPIRMVIPYPPGGGTDVMGRALAQQVAIQMGQPVVVENKPGANGSIATSMVVNSAPDGYTVLYAPTTILTANPHLYRLTYDVEKDLTPVALGPTTNFVLVAHPSAPFNTLEEMIAYAKSNPGKLTFATAGKGSHAHLLVEMLKGAAGIDVLDIPYKGGAPALSDVLGGQVLVLFDIVQTVQPHLLAGKLKALAVSRAQRSALLPNVPSISETLQGIDSGSSHGVYMASGGQKAIVERLNTEFTTALSAPDVQRRIVEGGYESKGATASEFDTMVKNEYRMMGTLIKNLGIKPE